MEKESKARGGLEARARPVRVVVATQYLLLGAACALIAITAGTARWNVGQMVVIATMTVVSDLTAVWAESARIRMSGSFLGIVLAAVLLGGGPAAVVGMLTISIGWFRSREAGHYFLNNLVTFAWFPLISGLTFHAAVHLLHVGPAAPSFYLLVFAAFLLALVVDFVGVVAFQCHLDRSSVLRSVPRALLPVLSAELFSALLTMVAVYVAVDLGIVGLALFALVLVIFQYLVGELLLSQKRSKELHRMATIDDLTGLANRERFRLRVEEEVTASRSAGRPFAVIIMDLDRFKEVNDTLGHDYGDKLLAELGPRLAECVGQNGMVARLGGDEFAVFPGFYTDDGEQLEAFAMRLLDELKQPIHIEGLSLELEGSAGVSRFPEDGDDAHTLLRRADLAMYAAKERQSGCKLYSTELDRESAQRLAVLSEFRRALMDGEIVVHYQPIVDMKTLAVRGAEGLVRWEHPERGLLPPAVFIDAVEQTGLIGLLTHHVLERAIAQCAEWRRDGNDMYVAVNLSVRNLLDRELPAEIERLLSEHSLPADALQLEITESMIMSDPERAMVTVRRLSDLGIHLSLDDFGTGYSSLANLSQLPIKELKIDRSFVIPMLQEEDNLNIVRWIINLGHHLKLRVVAEGVEDKPTLTQLERLGADRAQGYHLSKPLPPDEFAEWLGRTGLSEESESDLVARVSARRAAAG